MSITRRVDFLYTKAAMVRTSVLLLLTVCFIVPASAVFTVRHAVASPATTDAKAATSQAMTAELFLLVNAQRSAAGIPALTRDAVLDRLANARATELQQRFEHIRPDGMPWSDLLAGSGIECAYTGENIALGQETPEEVMRDWMQSLGHRANILSRDFDRLGLGVYWDDTGRDGTGQVHWVQIFIGE